MNKYIFTSHKPVDEIIQKLSTISCKYQFLNTVWYLECDDFLDDLFFCEITCMHDTIMKIDASDGMLSREPQEKYENIVQINCKFKSDTELEGFKV